MWGGGGGVVWGSGGVKMFDFFSNDSGFPDKPIFKEPYLDIGLGQPRQSFRIFYIFLLL